MVQIVRFCALERPVAERISRQQKIRKIQARSCDVKELWSRGTGPQGGPFRVASLGLEMCIRDRHCVRQCLSRSPGRRGSVRRSSTTSQTAQAASWLGSSGDAPRGLAGGERAPGLVGQRDGD